MSGVRRCKEFLLNLESRELKSVKVKIKRKNVPEPHTQLPLYRGLDDPKNLVIHFKTETLRGIFDREDIVVNQEFPEERKSKRSRSRSSSREDEHYRKRRSNRYDNRSSHRSKSRSKSSENSSPRYRKHSRSRDSHRRSRSYSPSSQPIKKPGLYIPPKSDYLRYEKRNLRRSRSKSKSPLPSTSKDKRYNSRSPSRHHERGSKSPYRDNSSSPRKSRERYDSRKRKHSQSRSPRHDPADYSSRSRRSPSSRRRYGNGSNSPTRRRRYRSRSRSRHQERHSDCGSSHNVRCYCKDPEYWMPPMHAPPFHPRGYIGAPMIYPRGFPPMIMHPRMPMMQPYRPRIFQPRAQTATSDTISKQNNENDEKSLETQGDEDKEVPASTVTISEINVEDKK